MTVAGVPAAERRYRIAVVGAGPAGFYAAEALLRASGEIAVDLYDRLPTPYGLVRYGVAPDHPKLKQVITVFQGIAAMPGFRFLGNIALGEDVSLEALRRHYHAVILCCGAEHDRPLAIPGEGLPGVHGGMAFVGWYNGHPDRRALAPDLSGKNAIVLGLGNVALDVARILAKPAAALAATDIASHALGALVASGLRRVVVAGRGGPAQARCTDKELKEFRHIPDCVTTAARGHYEIAPQQGIPALFEGFPVGADAPYRHCHFAFGLRPLEILGGSRVEAVRFARSEVCDGIAAGDVDDGDIVDLPADLVIACIGSEATRVPGLPYRGDRRAVRNSAGRVEGAPGLYVSGWIKRGASGTIGTNRADSVETVASLLGDLAALPEPAAPVAALTGTGTPIGRKSISFARWEQLDRLEIEAGARLGKPREKIIRFEQCDDAVDEIIFQ